MTRIFSALAIPATSTLRSIRAPAALRQAFPSADYYGHSVALGLAACRRSRVRSNRTSERDVGPSFDPLNDLAGRRLTGGKFERRNWYRPIPPASPVHAVAMDVRFHPWSLGSSNPALTLSRGPCGRRVWHVRPPPASRSGSCPLRLSPSGKIDGPETSFPASPACGRYSIRRFHGAQLPRTRLKPPRRGKRSPAARSTRSWFRLTGGFRHPSLSFSLRCLTSPSVEASSLIAPLRPAGSLHPFGLGIPARAALSPPLQRSLRFLRHPLPPPPSPSLRSEYRRLAATGRVGLTLLSNVERRMGRLRPIVRRVLVPPSSRVPIDDPTACPFGPGLSAPLAGSR